MFPSYVGKNLVLHCVFLPCVSTYKENTSLLTLWSPNVGGMGFPTLKRNSKTPVVWGTNNSTQFWHYLPSDSIRSHRGRAQAHKTATYTPKFRCQSQAKVITWASHQPAIDQRFQRSPSLAQLLCYSPSQNSGKHIYQVIKGYDKGHRRARWRDTWGEVLKDPKCRSFCPCGAEMRHPPDMDVFTNLKALQTPYYWDFMEAFINFMGMIHY